MKLLKSEDFSYDFDVPSEDFISIYEHFLDLVNLGKSKSIDRLDDLEKFPNKRWYQKMTALIEELGFETYRNHVIAKINELRKNQSAHKKLKALKKQDSKNNIFKRDADYFEGKTYIIPEAPTHFYFYCSRHGRYLKGMIHSVYCIPDPELLNLIERFAVECPFQVGGHSQAPTGLYVYDILKVFSMLGYPKNVPYILVLKSNIKQTYAQKRINKALNDIAKKQEISLESLYELNIANYGIDEELTYKKSVGHYQFCLSFPTWNKKEINWLNQQSGRTQKIPPKELREDHPEKLKLINLQTKEIENQLKIQAKRIERNLLINRDWETSFWKKVYYQNTFVKILSKDLLWQFFSGNTNVIGYIQETSIVSINERPINLTNVDRVKLWHPLLSSQSEFVFIKEKFGHLLESQCFNQVERNVYNLENIKQFIGKKMDKAKLSQLCKARAWTTSGDKKLRIQELGITVILKIADANDGKKGRLFGAKNAILTEIVFQKDQKEISADHINKVTLSEILRDVDLFTTVAKEDE